MEQRQVDQMKEQRPVGQNTEQRPVNPYALWLTGIEGVGGKTIRALMRRASGAEEVYNMSEEEIRRCLSETMKKQADAVRMASRITRAHRERPEEQLGNKVLYYNAAMDRLMVAVDLDREKEREKER